MWLTLDWGVLHLYWKLKVCLQLVDEETIESPLCSMFVLRNVSLFFMNDKHFARDIVFGAQCTRTALCIMSRTHCFVCGVAFCALQLGGH